MARLPRGAVLGPMPRRFCPSRDGSPQGVISAAGRGYSNRRHDRACHRRRRLHRLPRRAALLRRGESVIGVDNLNDYYAVALKRGAARGARARASASRFHRLDLAERGALEPLLTRQRASTASSTWRRRPGVRYSLENPACLRRANLVGPARGARSLPASARVCKHLVFASSSSVYGGNTKLPFAVEDPRRHAAIALCRHQEGGRADGARYAHLYRLPTTGLRFFTVYGPWGRPDMAAWLFTEAILAGKPIKLFNHGKMRRDFTYIDDIVAACSPASTARPPASGEPPYRLYNIGNNRSEELDALRRGARSGDRPARPTDRARADAAGRRAGDLCRHRRRRSAISASSPATSIEEGLPRFVAWYRGTSKAGSGCPASRKARPAPRHRRGG